MKTAAKVFVILGMVIGCIAIIPIVIGILALKKLNDSTDKQEVMLWGILALFLCSPLGGIFMIVYSDSLKSAA